MTEPRTGWSDEAVKAAVEGAYEVGRGAASAPEPKTVEVLSLFDDIINRLGGLPCDGHEDFAAGTFLFHRERECPDRVAPISVERLAQAMAEHSADVGFQHSTDSCGPGCAAFVVARLDIAPTTTGSHE